MPPPRIVVPARHWSAVVDHLQACLPLEGCGLLAGRGDRVDQVWPIENRARSPVRYFMQPHQLVRSLTAIEDQGRQLLAAYHSHPLGPDGVSTSDVAEWQYPESALAVWRPGASGWTARAFVVLPHGAKEIPLVVAAD